MLLKHGPHLNTEETKLEIAKRSTHEHHEKADEIRSKTYEIKPNIQQRKKSERAKCARRVVRMNNIRWAKNNTRMETKIGKKTEGKT